MRIEKNYLLIFHDLQNSNQSLSLFSIQKVQIDKKWRSISCLYDKKVNDIRCKESK